MCRRGRKRVLDDEDFRVSAPPDLPPQKQLDVAAALERWRALRVRAEDIRPVLEREEQLMQEILDCGLGGEDRRTLRRLVSGNSEDVEEEVVQQVLSAIGAEMQALQEILVLNRRELLELSATVVPERKRDLVSGLDAVRSELQSAQDVARRELLAAKERGDLDMLRSFGRSFNDLKALLQRLECDRRKLTRNSALAALLVTVCRRVLPVRHINPSELRDIPASYEGYLRIADFHLFSDAGLYDFGEHGSGPNLFTRLRRNVAILLIRDCSGKVVYNAFAVSGALNTPGVSPALPCGPLRSVEAEDEHGRLFDRRHDAEFKLLSCLCDAFEAARTKEADAAALSNDGVKASSASAAPTLQLEPGTTASSWKSTGRLWSRKPLCRSCLGAVRQLGLRFPHLQLEVVVGDDDEAVPSELLRPQDLPVASTSPTASTSVISACSCPAVPLQAACSSPAERPEPKHAESQAAWTPATFAPACSSQARPTAANAVTRVAATMPEAIVQAAMPLSSTSARRSSAVTPALHTAATPPSRLTASASARSRSPRRSRRSPPRGWLAGQMSLAHGQRTDAIGCA